MTEYQHDIATVASRNAQMEEHLKDRTRSVRAIGIVFSLLALLGFFGWQVWTVVAPPELAVLSPGESMVVHERMMTISGTVTPGSDLAINNSTVLVEDDGSFAQEITLHAGTNEFVVTAKKRYSAEAIVSRSVYYQINEVVQNAGFSVTN